LKQTTSKSVATKEKSFNLLRSVVLLVPGCLDGQSSIVVANVQKALSGISATTSGSGSTSLVITVLAFLGAFVESHPSRIYASSLPQLVDSTVRFMADKYQRVSLEALGTAASLAKALRPTTISGDAIPLPSVYVTPVQKLYEAVCEIISGSAADSDVRDKALYAISDLLTHEGEVLAPLYDKSLPLVSARLNTDSNQVAALTVIQNVAGSKACSGDYIEKWLLSVLEQFAGLLRRCPKQNRAKALAVLETLTDK
jgi:cullin-associated NEDD8-dissociated protein 1